jgi:hypothetical protein
MAPEDLQTLAKTKEDNQGAIALARNPVAHSRTKHTDIRFILYEKHWKRVPSTLSIVPQLKRSLICLLNLFHVTSLKSCVFLWDLMNLTTTNNSANYVGVLTIMVLDLISTVRCCIYYCSLTIFFCECSSSRLLCG